MRVFPDIVKFLRRTFVKAKFEEFLRGGFVAMVEDIIFGRAIVTIAEWPIRVLVGLRVACGPAVRPKIPQVKKVAGADSAYRITDIIRADVGMALAFEENDASRA